MISSLNDRLRGKNKMAKNKKIKGDVCEYPYSEFWDYAKLREEILCFSDKMIAEICRKEFIVEGETDCPISYLFSTLKIDVQDLEYELTDMDRTIESVTKECVDVASIAMMISWSMRKKLMAIDAGK